MRSVGEAMVRLFGLSLALAFVASASGCGLSLLVGGIAASASGGSSSSTVATVPAPEVTAISPATASHMGGMSATITGSNFPTDGVSLPTVTVGGTAATSVQVIDANTLTIVLPSASTVGPDTRSEYVSFIPVIPRNHIRAAADNSSAALRRPS